MLNRIRNHTRGPEFERNYARLTLIILCLIAFLATLSVCQKMDDLANEQALSLQEEF